MKKELFKAKDRGYANHGWLKSHHTFSFANFYDPKREHFGALRVVNDDTVAGGMGFSKHRHDNMEIISIPLAGALQHEDSEGNKTVIKQGEVQIMSAGTGIFHSEKNNSHSEEVQFFQIWVFPKLANILPRYDQKLFDMAGRTNKFQIVVSPDFADGGVIINQDAVFYLGYFEENITTVFKKKFENNLIFIMVIEGEVEIENERLLKRDAIGLSDFTEIEIKSVINNTTLLVIEVPK